MGETGTDASCRGASAAPREVESGSQIGLTRFAVTTGEGEAGEGAEYRIAEEGWVGERRGM
eukprot:1222747-Amorphochlora_amoeboformis.AAC.1